MDDVIAARGKPLVEAGGEHLGPVTGIYLDDATGRPTWLAVEAPGGSRLVPVDGADLADDEVRVAYPATQIVASPVIDENHISEADEDALYGHYGLDHVWHDAPTEIQEPGAGAELTRFEEELHVDKRSDERGRIRLRKWVETEPVSVDVDLRREVAHIIAEPVGEVVGAHEFVEDEIQIALHAEEPILQKRVVAKERIGVEKSLESTTQTISDELRKERVEVDEGRWRKESE